MSAALTVRLELFVDDLTASRAFLEHVLLFETRRVSGDYIELVAGDVCLGLGTVAGLPAGHPARPAHASAPKGSCIEIVLETDDVDDFERHVRSTGYPIAVPLDVRPWGLRDFRVVAPEGFYIRVTSKG